VEKGGRKLGPLWPWFKVLLSGENPELGPSPSPATTGHGSAMGTASLCHWTPHKELQTATNFACSPALLLGRD